MTVAHCTRTMPGPGRAAIVAANDCTGLNTYYDHLGISGRQRDGLHRGDKGRFCRGEPQPAERDVTETRQFCPGGATVTRRKQQRWFGSSKDCPWLKRADGQCCDAMIR